MKNLLGLLLCLSIAFPALADSTLQVNGRSISGLTDVQIAELQAQAAKLAEANGQKATTPAVPPVATVEQVAKYAELGKSIGAGLASTAKELGIAVNEFADTPIGKVALIIIVVKLIGSQVFHVILGTVWFLVALPLWFYFYRRLCMFDYKYTEYDEKGRKHTKTQYLTNPTASIVATRWALFVILVAICGVGFLVI